MKQIKLVLMLSLGVLSALPARAEEAAGEWLGVLGGQWRLVFHIQKSADGQYVGTVDSPDQDDPPRPLSHFQTDAHRLTFSMAQDESTYEGAWDAKQNAWTGAMKFWDIRFPLNLSRVDAAAIAPVKLRRPQEEAIAAAPLPYAAEPVKFDNPRAPGINLVGTFTKPNGAGPFPALLFITGAGNIDRDGTVDGGHKNTWVLADDLTRRGIAVLRYDKRGVGQSTGKLETATYADLISDAEAALNFMKARQDVDPKRIGVLGQSQGGAIAPHLAIDDSSVAYIVMLAAPALRGDKQYVATVTLNARSLGASDADIAQGTAFNRELFDTVLTAKDPPAAQKAVKALLARQKAAHQLTDSAAEAFQDFPPPEVFQRLRDDPAVVISKMRIPVLALAGSLDHQVPPRENLEAIRQALKDNPHATVIEFPGVNHSLQPAKTGLMSEYLSIDISVAPEVLRTVGDWVVANTRAN